MANILAALKRHNIYRVAAAYAVVAWVLGQLVGILMPVFDLPQWFARAFLLLLALGLPVAIFFAWANQLAPESGGPARVSTGKLDWFLAGALVVVIALMSYQQLAPSRTVQSQQAGVEAARAASSAQSGAISIVVLPFANMSGDASQEFFSDGMTEEITAALAKVPDLRVVGRTSAFQFKGANKDLRAIGQSLSATHLIEGSVRKEGSRVRITVQLIKADDGTHLWAENYDRELTGIFAIQEDIARAISAALRMPLGLKPGENLVNNRTTDTESYQDYLRARTLVRVRGLPARMEAAGLLERAVARDPNYAPAWGMLGQAYAAIAFPEDPAASLNRSADEIRRVTSESLQKAEAAAQKAIRLDPNHIDGYTALALAQNYRGQFVQAEDLYKQALSLDPGNPEALNQYSLMLVLVGRLKDSLAMRLRLKELEPFVGSFTGPTGNVLALNGRNDEAMAILSRGLPRTAAIVAELYVSMGRYSEAADTLRGIPSGSVLPGAGSVPPGAVEEAIRLLRNAPAQTPSPQTILKGTPFAFVYVYAGAPDRVLEPFERSAETGLLGDPRPGPRLWAPLYAPLRKTERFKAFVRKIGLVDYWKARGWPELCHAMGATDFVCE